MCTLTFLPGMPGGGYLLATNRDESVQRGEAQPPTLRAIGGRQVLAPEDRDAGGTWIGVDDAGRCLAILNGDGAPAAPPPDPPVSRGLLVLELLEDLDAGALQRALERRRAAGRMPYRPFKLVLATPGDGGGSREATLLRGDWDGATLAFHELVGPTCIVSSTRQPEQATAARGAAFARMLPSLPPPDAPGAVHEREASQRRVHASHSAEAPHGGPLTICMHRDEARTVSSTQVVVTAGEVSMRYQPGPPCEGRVALTTALRRSGVGPRNGARSP